MASAEEGDLREALGRRQFTDLLDGTDAMRFLGALFLDITERILLNGSLGGVPPGLIRMEQSASMISSLWDSFSLITGTIRRSKLCSYLSFSIEATYPNLSNRHFMTGGVLAKHLRFFQLSKTLEQQSHYFLASGKFPYAMWECFCVC